MPGLAHKSERLSNVTSSCYSRSTTNGSVSSVGFWSKHSDDISYNQLQKFWSELPPNARQRLLRIDKQTLFEQARKNLYCSRCNGLLLEGFLQIVMYGKSLHQDKINGQLLCYKSRGSKDQMIDGSGENLASQDEAPDPSVHPWGGLTTTRDGALTLLDCYLYAKSLSCLQNVFDSARARERERELLYPDACGGGGRGWISQGMVGYGRGHGSRETCALHTARLSCDTLIDFWSALGEETRQSLLRMKEEDFIERLMYRFDSKRFCRDCRRNVIREFKELKELKRIKREPRCTTWFCVADTAFEYEVSNSTIHANWQQAFIDSVGIYDHFEWAAGTTEGKFDILDFKNVGKERSVQANGLDLDGFNACYITLRACKLGGRYTELSVKAHALKGQQCVHCRLMVGDGYVTMSHGESIRRFFEHAEEAEEEEDDDSIDRDGNDLDGECSRPQKHAKSPELAREFLLDAATVIFKEQVEKAFREGTARQNAHNIFVCLSLKLLEERVHVACKEITTLQKQMKLLEEEEKEKREEEERKERKRIKEREKKLRRKERLRGKDKEKKYADSDQSLALPDVDKVSSPSMDEDVGINIEEPATANNTVSSLPDHRGEWGGTDGTTSNGPSNNFDAPDVEHVMSEYDFTVEKSKLSRSKIKLHRDFQLDSSEKRPERRGSLESNSLVNRPESRYCNENFLCSSRGTGDLNRQLRAGSAKINPRNSNLRLNQKLQCSIDKVVDQTDPSECGCNQLNDYKTKVDPWAFGNRMNRDSRFVNQTESSNQSKPVLRSSKLNQSDSAIHDTCGRSRSSKTSANLFGRELPHTKKVWEPVEPKKRYPRSSSDIDVTLRSSTYNIIEGANSVQSETVISSGRANGKLVGTINVGKRVDETQTTCNSKEVAHSGNGLHLTRSCKSNGSPNFSASSSSSSDNCSSCVSEGDSNAGSSHLPIMGSSTSSSDSEDGSQLSEAGRDASICIQNVSESRCGNIQSVEVQATADIYKATSSPSTSVILTDNSRNLPQSPFSKISSQDVLNGKIGEHAGLLNQIMLPPVHLNQSNIQYQAFQAPTAMGYHHQNHTASWSTGHTNAFVPYVHPSGQYLFPNPFSYGLNGGESPFCMQYAVVQHLAPPPILSPTHVPVYQPVLHSSGSQLRDQNSLFIPHNGAVESCHGEDGRGNEAPLGHRSQKEAPSVNGTIAGTNGFSLFKFGGPLALSPYKPTSNSSNEGVCEDHYSSVVSAGLFDAENTCCHKKDANIEEYNLFAASKGIEFSIF